jgi:hypothetical protein
MTRPPRARWRRFDQPLGPIAEVTTSERQKLNREVKTQALLYAGVKGLGR